MKKCFEFPDKRRFASKKDAETTLLIWNLNYKIYQCQTCKGWHFASK
jgi:hypothetical protein